VRQSRARAGLIAALLALALVGPATAEERRLDLFDTKGRWTGHVIVDESTGRLDTYDRAGRRTGGRVGPRTGDVELFDLDGARQRLRPGRGPARGAR
jgi:hypothetical protein